MRTYKKIKVEKKFRNFHVNKKILPISFTDIKSSKPVITNNLYPEEEQKNRGHTLLKR